MNRLAQQIGLMVACAAMPLAEAGADTLIYSVHVGVNEPPPGTNLPRLRYADDDAARFFGFAKGFAREARLLTVLDADSQRRDPAAATSCETPNLFNLTSILKGLARRMQADRAAGHTVVFYFSYSGHGVSYGGETRLTVLGGSMDRNWLERNVMNLPADSVHLIIDACHAEGLVGSRGVIQREVSAPVRPLQDRERSILLEDGLLDRYPHVGALLASTREAEAQEWSKLQSGVFTHEVLSALAGAADINQDGRVAYSEVAAFLAAANGGVRDRRAVPQVVSMPPRRDRNTPLFAFTWAKNASVLVGRITSSTWFWAETQAGVRLFDVHPEAGMRLNFVVPANTRIWVRRGDVEASFTSIPAGLTDLSRLTFNRIESVTTRGSIAQSLQQGLFAEAFGPAYYRGWVAQSGEPSVLLGQDLAASQLTFTGPSRTPAIVSLVGAGAAAVATGVFGYLTYQAKRDYDRADTQSASAAARDSYRANGFATIGCGVAAIGLGILSWVLWPSDDRHVGPTVAPPDPKEEAPKNLFESVPGRTVTPRSTPTPVPPQSSN